MKKIVTKISLFILIGIIYSACNSVKKVPENKHLLTKTKILVDGKGTNDEDITNLLYQTPNTAFLGYRFRLNLFNLSKKNQDSSYKAKFIKNPAKYHRQVRFLSAKQVKRKGQSFFYAGIDNFLKNTGEPPVIIDLKKTEKTLIRLKSHYFNLGYYNATANFKIDTIDKKKAQITYNITKGKASFLDTITPIIDSPELDTLYQKINKNTFLKKGKQFKSEDFVSERERLTNYFRNHGVYNFQQSNITYNIDTIKTGNKANVDLFISDFSYRDGDSTKTKPFKKYRISEVNVYTDANKMVGKNKSAITDSISCNNINLFSTTKLRYKPKALTDAIFITKGSLYSDDKTTLTSRYLANLKNFNYPNIQYVIDSRDTIHNSLIANLYLTPLDKRHFSTALDLTHSNIQEFGILGSAAVLVRNIFKGTETFEIAGRANIGASKTSSNPHNNFFNVSEFGIDTRLNFPRVVFPGNTDKIIPRSMLPTTAFSLGFSKQNNIGLDKESFLSAVRYDWKPRRNVTARFDLLNIQYVNNLNISNYYNVYESSYDELNGIAQNPSYPVNPGYFNGNHDLIIESGTKGFTTDVLANNFTTTADDYNSVRSLEEKRIRLTENNLIFSSAYHYSKTTKKDILDNSFYAFRTKFESAGNFLSLVATMSKELNKQDGNNTIFGVVYSQYFKSEFEYIKHFNLTHKRTLALRSFFGIAIPYGNSDNIPFSRSYFAGGSNDIRAWQPYSLGPGSTGAINDFNEANMKITLNAEYRFNLISSLNGALFIDSGNIWHTLDDISDPKAVFSGFSSLKNMAIGIGLGVRYDLEIFVVRVDWGFKTYDPSLESGQKWFTKFGIKDSVLNFGINYPF